MEYVSKLNDIEARKKVDYMENVKYSAFCLILIILHRDYYF